MYMTDNKQLEFHSCLCHVSWLYIAYQYYCIIPSSDSLPIFLYCIFIIHRGISRTLLIFLFVPVAKFIVPDWGDKVDSGI
jgi:hypothetical protein